MHAFVRIHTFRSKDSCATACWWITNGDGGGVACRWFGDSVCDRTMGVIGAWQDYSAGLSCWWQLWAPLWLALFFSGALVLLLWCSGACALARWCSDALVLPKKPPTPFQALPLSSLQWNRTTTDHQMFWLRHQGGKFTKKNFPSSSSNLCWQQCCARITMVRKKEKPWKLELELEQPVHWARLKHFKYFPLGSSHLLCLGFSG